MTEEKKIKVTFSIAERDLILTNQLIDKEYFQSAEVKDGSIELDLSYEQIEDILGFLIAEASYSEDDTLEEKLAPVCERLEKHLEEFDD